jgi:hypothetical protein
MAAFFFALGGVLGFIAVAVAALWIARRRR